MEQLVVREKPSPGRCAYCHLDLPVALPIAPIEWNLHCLAQCSSCKAVHHGECIWDLGMCASCKTPLDGHQPTAAPVLSVESVTPQSANLKTTLPYGAVTQCIRCCARTATKTPIGLCPVCTLRDEEFKKATKTFSDWLLHNRRVLLLFVALLVIVGAAWWPPASCVSQVLLVIALLGSGALSHTDSGGSQ